MRELHVQGFGLYPECWGATFLLLVIRKDNGVYDVGEGSLRIEVPHCVHAILLSRS